MSSRRVSLTLAAVLFFFSAAAIATSFTPARIGNHNESLAKTISFPDGVDGDVSVFLRCEAKVYPGGTIDEAGCYGDESTDPSFFRAVNLGSESASMTPATVNGEQVPVRARSTAHSAFHRRRRGPTHNGPRRQTVRRAHARAQPRERQVHARAPQDLPRAAAPARQAAQGAEPRAAGDVRVERQ